jgi:hypothetical protein
MINDEISDLPLDNFNDEIDPIAQVEERMNKRFKCNAVINKVSTQVDGGYRLTLDISEQDLEVATELMRIKKNDGMVNVTFKLINR